MPNPIRNTKKLPSNDPLPPPANRRSPDAVMDQLHAQLADVAEQARLVENTADAEKRPMTEDEVKTVQQLHGDFERIEAEIDARVRSQKMDERMRQPRERLTNADPVEASADEPADDDEEPAPMTMKKRLNASRPRITGGEPAGARRGSGGFRSIGEFAIAAHQTFNGKHDARIMNAPSSYGQEAVGADGGFALPPDFRQQIMKTVMGEDSLLGRTDQQQTSSNAITLPQDTTTPWQTSGGVLGAWIGEGQTITGTKPQLGQLECRAHKLAALVPLTDELLEDVPSMTRWLESKVPDKFTSLINDAIVNGDGNMKPKGIMQAACKITVAAESGQGAGTVVAKNILKMWGRLYGKLRPNAIWLINQDVEQQLQQLTMPGTNPSQPAYMPPGGFSVSPYATLLGRPIIPLEACAAVGTEGDIILTDPSQYLTVLKSGGMRTDVSIHLYFDSDHTAFRFVMRVGGQSYWPAAIARQNGSNTLSPIVTLNSTRT
jgi:HK97 family phage major capsid protein